MYSGLTAEQLNPMIRVVPRALVPRAFCESGMREGIVAAIDRKLQEFREIRGMDEMSEKRLGLIDRFIRATRMVDRYVDTVIAIRFGILAGARATQPMEQGMYQNRKSTLMEQFEAARPQL